MFKRELLQIVHRLYHSTSRVLTILELLQSRSSITGPELAARQEMDIRTWFADKLVDRD